MERYKFDAASKTLIITAGYAKKMQDTQKENSVRTSYTIH